MGKYRRGGYIFITWKGDHPPRHVHVYRDDRLIVKWDLDNQKAMTGAITRRILDLIAELESEGLLWKSALSPTTIATKRSRSARQRRAWRFRSRTLNQRQRCGTRSPNCSSIPKALRTRLRIV